MEVFSADQLDEVNRDTVMAGVSLFIIYVSLLFMLTVFCDQVVIILNRLSILDRVRLDQKRLVRNQVKKRGYQNYQETFGSPFGFKWLLPTVPSRQLPVEELYH